jgi:hypothetical protein
MVASGDQNFAVREECRRMCCPRRGHDARRCERAIALAGSAGRRPGYELHRARQDHHDYSALLSSPHPAFRMGKRERRGRTTMSLASFFRMAECHRLDRQMLLVY